MILFTRNYDTPASLHALCNDIHALRSPPLLIAVDQEGGRVQRFRQGFSMLPPAHLIGRQYDLDTAKGMRLARTSGWLMAAELRALGVDFSFAPVLDLDWGFSQVIGDRAFHRDPETVSRLGQSFAAGMRAAGMAATAKHFPGHGAVAADSHTDLPVDRRAYADIAEDMLPFERAISAGIAAVMTAHVVYADVDHQPATFSRHWIENELRNGLDFSGVVFSDDLAMAAAEAIASDCETRARLALDAGCDAILVCNSRDQAIEIIDALNVVPDPVRQVRLASMHGRPATDREALRAGSDWQKAASFVAHCRDLPELRLQA